MKGKPDKLRRPLIRLVLIVLWIALGVLLFVKNRGHTLLVDNKDIESRGLTAPDLIKVTLDGKDTLEFFRGDRDLFRVKGSDHRLRVEFSDGAPPFETGFSLPLGPDMFILSIPKTINGIEPYFEVFHTQQESRNAEEDAPEASF
jgi:hypothetical protein